MAKKTAKKKSAAKKVSAKPMTMSVEKSCKCHEGDMWLCKISLIAAVFFLMGLIPQFGDWVVHTVVWWIWLVIAIIFGWKPLMKVMKK